MSEPRVRPVSLYLQAAATVLVGSLRSPTQAKSPTQVGGSGASAYGVEKSG